MTRLGKISLTDWDSTAVSDSTDSAVVVVVGHWKGVNSIKHCDSDGLLTVPNVVLLTAVPIDIGSIT